jgi:calcineurin-like phosphoesterase family protein
VVRPVVLKRATLWSLGAVILGFVGQLAIAPARAVPLFADGFESGDLSRWTFSTGMTAQQQEVLAGQYAARATSTGIATYAYRSLAAAQTNLFAVVHFKVMSRAGAVTLLRLQRGSGTNVVQVYLTDSGMLAYRNEVAKVNRISSTPIGAGEWHQLQIHVQVSGAASVVEVWLDDAPVSGLNQTESLGTGGLRRVEIGNRSTKRTYDLVFDDISVDTSRVGSVDAPPTTPGNLRLATPATDVAHLVWDPSSDDSSVTSYTVYRDNVEIATVAGSASEFVDEPPSATTVYVYTVVATDDTGNRSARAAPLRVSMSGFDPSTDATVFAAGDIACASRTPTANSCWQGPTSDILVEGRADGVLAVGDLQYEDATLAAFMKSFDPTWGRVKPSIHPAPGNHEYATPGAAGYFDYFGAAAGDRSQGYYSFDLGAWHLISLNSNCGAVSCAAGSPQETWLRADLQAHQSSCTLAFWHSPMWSSVRPDKSVGGAFMRALYEAGADVVVVAHDHVYERFARQDPSGALDLTHGIRQFTAGMGGRSHYTFDIVHPRSEARDGQTFGVLKLTLHPQSYEWGFVPAWGDGPYVDRGREDCHGAPATP